MATAEIDKALGKLGLDQYAASVAMEIAKTAVGSLCTPRRVTPVRRAGETYISRNRGDEKIGRFPRVIRGWAKRFRAKKPLFPPTLYLKPGPAYRITDARTGESGILDRTMHQHVVMFPWVLEELADSLEKSIKEAQHSASRKALLPARQATYYELRLVIFVAERNRGNPMFNETAALLRAIGKERRQERKRGGSPYDYEERDYTAKGLRNRCRRESETEAEGRGEPLPPHVASLFQ